MPRDNERLITVDNYRQWAGSGLLNAAKHAYTGNYWLASHEAAEALKWLKRAEEVDKAEAEAARIAAECAAFDAAIAECPHAA